MYLHLKAQKCIISPWIGNILHILWCCGDDILQAERVGNGMRTQLINDSLLVRTCWGSSLLESYIPATFDGNGNSKDMVKKQLLVQCQFEGTKGDFALPCNKVERVEGWIGCSLTFSSVDLPSCISGIFIDTHIYHCNLFVHMLSSSIENRIWIHVWLRYVTFMTFKLQMKRRGLSLICVCRVSFERINKILH